jgi:hypothetical protein
MQCDYCGQEILGRPINIEIPAEDLGPDNLSMAGDFSFCSTECHSAYLDEAGIQPESEITEDAEEDEDFLFSDRAMYDL